MSTLISVYKGEHCIGRCDAKCYNASTAACECDCICHGMNHGAGATKAEKNTKEYADEWVKKYFEEKNINDGKAVVNPELFQLKLF